MTEELHIGSPAKPRVGKRAKTGPGMHEATLGVSLPLVEECQVLDLRRILRAGQREVVINKAAAAGWRLVAVDNDWAYLVRPAVPAADAEAGEVPSLAELDTTE